MSLIPSKQIDKLMSGTIQLTALATTAATSVVVTTPLTTAASNAGSDGAGGTTSVPVQPSSGTGPGGMGFITTGALNRVEINDATTKKKLVDASNNEVYGRLTQSAGVYTLSYFTLVAGTETAFTAAIGSIDFTAPYRYTLTLLPADTGIGGIGGTPVNNDPTGTGSRIKIESLTPTGLNTFPALSQTPVAGGILKVHVNGVTVDSLSGSGLTYSGTAATWNAATAGFNITTTDRCVAEYPY
jgi:hypothetical protein